MEQGARSMEQGACTHALTTHGARSTEHGARSTEHARMHARTEHGALNNDVLFKLDEITNTVCRFIKFYFPIFNNKIIVLESH